MDKKPPLDPQLIFEQGERFFATLLQLHQTKSADLLNLIGIPLTVLTAFASELYLKAIRCSETGKAIQSHLLFDLFTGLSAESQKVIEKHWDAQAVSRKEILDRFDQSMGKPVPRDLKSNLEAGSDGFRLIRYVYEGGQDFIFNLGDLPLVLRRAIEELRPDWLAKPRSFFKNPHAVFVEGKEDAPHFGVTWNAKVDSQTTSFYWEAGNSSDGNNGGS